MNNTWTKEFEMTKYWDAVMNDESLTDSYNKEFLKQKQYFKLDNYINDLKGTIVDIGGGAFGGVFNFLDIGDRKILVDPLGDVFKEKFNKIPDDVEVFNIFCSDIQFPSKSIDSVFCINALDHCNSIEEFNKSLINIERILKPGGYLFFMLPLRESPVEGHFIYHGNVSRYTIQGRFSNYNILLTDWDYHCFYMVAKRND